MRTTLDIEDDILMAAKEIARDRGTTIGRVISELARTTLTQAAHVTEDDGLPLFPIQPNAGIVTLELVNRLRDETK
jgi:hypothetical protein